MITNNQFTYIKEKKIIIFHIDGYVEKESKNRMLAMINRATYDPKFRIMVTDIPLEIISIDLETGHIESSKYIPKEELGPKKLNKKLKELVDIKIAEAI